MEFTLGLLLGLICAAIAYVCGESAGRNTNDELVAALERCLTLARAGKTGAPVLNAWAKAARLFRKTEDLTNG